MIWGRHEKVVVEIGTDQLKICRFREGGRKSSCFVKTVRLADIKGPLPEELPSLLKSLGLQNQRVVTYLPRKLVNLRFLEIPSTDPVEVADIVKLQGIKQTPYSREEVVLSHTLVGSRREGYSDVVLAFCQRKFIDERINLLAGAGLKPDQIGVSTEGVAEWYTRNQALGGSGPTQGLVILIDCDSSYSDVLFLQDGRFLFSRNISAGIAKLIPISDEGIESFCMEIIQAIELTSEEFRIPHPKKAVVISSAPVNPKLRETIEKKLGLFVEIVDPTASLQGKADLAVENDASITPLIGFARMKTPLFDLVPEETRLQRSVEQKGKQIVATAACALGFLVAASLLLGGYFYQRKTYLEKLEAEIGKTQEIASSIEAKLIRTKLLEKMMNAETSFLSHLEKIAGLLPDGIYFTSIEYIEEDKINLKGNAIEISEVFNFVKALEDAKIFKGVKSEHVSKKKSGEEVLANFDIVCRL